MNNKKIGFVGTGWIGGTYNKNFIKRGYETVQYSLEPEFVNNKEKLKECEIIFVAVPTPSTREDGFDDSILLKAIKDATIDGQIVIIKSTIKIGTTDKIQKLYPNKYIIHSPEFLTEKTCDFDAANPERNILGCTEQSKCKANQVMEVLPRAKSNFIVSCKEAEFVKYMGNCWFYFKVMAMNTFYDIAEDYELDFDLLKEMLGADSRVGKTHLDVKHQGGRGAGGACFIKDFEALIEMYKDIKEPDYKAVSLLLAAREYNKDLLKRTGKSLDLLKEIYG